MRKIVLQRVDAVDIEKFPKGWSLIGFWAQEELLYLALTPNSRRRYELMKQKTEDNTLISEMFIKADHVRIEPLNTALQGLIQYKITLQNRPPSMQHVFNRWENYVYLALNAYQYPFIRTTGNTNDEWLYLGPFRDRFALADALDAVCKILRLPRCETGDWPCYRLEEGSCAGWCRSLNEEETNEEYSLDKLDALLKESFLKPSDGVLELLIQEKDKYFNDLEFVKADLLSDEIEIQAKYRDWLQFLYVARQLSWEDELVQVQNGRLIKVKTKERDYNFLPDNTIYRDNERLALNLMDVDEARILYDHWMSQHQGKENV
jgi:hypothetical protein